MTTLLVGSAKVKKGHGAHDEWLEAVSQILCCMDAQQQQHQHQHQQQSEVTVEAKRLFLFRVSRSEKQKSVIPQAHMTARLGHAFFFGFCSFPTPLARFVFSNKGNRGGVSITNAAKLV